MSNISTITYNGSVIAETEEEGNVVVTYDGKTIASIGAGETKTLLCTNKNMNTNLTVGSKTLLCASRSMASDVVVDVASLTAYAVYSATDKSLTFYKTTDTITQGGTYNNKAATKVHTGFETATYTKVAEVPWSRYTSSIRKVTVVDEIKPVSTAFWFLNMEVCDSMNLSKLDTSNVSNMCRMFSGCEELTSVGDISGWDTSNAIDMSYMFYECGSLILDCSGWNVDKVTNHTNFKTSAPDVIAPTWVN